MVDTRKEVAVLDLGTSKICCAIAKSDLKNHNLDSIDSEKCIKIYGVGYQLAKGIKKNSITNLEDLEDSIVGTIVTAEKDAQKSIKSVLIALPSWAIESRTIRSCINLGQLPVDDIHLTSLVNINTTDYIEESRELIHMFPTSYAIDGTADIQDPIGMVGERLSANIHVMTAPKALVKNIKNCLNRNNINVEGFISSTYASGLSVLLNEEMSSGVTLIDIGGTTTSIAFFYNGSLCHMESIPIGSQNITNDIAIILRTTKSHAERLKILYGVASSDILSDNEEQCLVPRIDEYGEEHIQNVSRGMLDSIIGARLEEIIELVEERVRKLGKNSTISQRIVLTGGGSRISGLNEFIKAKRYFENAAIRLGKPINVTGSHDFVQTPSFATCSGIIFHVLSSFNSNVSRLTNPKKSLKQKLITWFRRGV